MPRCRRLVRAHTRMGYTAKGVRSSSGVCLFRHALTPTTSSTPLSLRVPLKKDFDPMPHR